MPHPEEEERTQERLFIPELGSAGGTVIVPTGTTRDQFFEEVRRKFPGARPKDLPILPGAGAQLIAPGTRAAQRAQLLSTMFDIPVEEGPFDAPKEFRFDKFLTEKPVEQAELLRTKLRDIGEEADIRLVEDPRTKGRFTILAKRPGETAFREVDPPGLDFPEDIQEAFNPLVSMGLETFGMTRFGAMARTGIKGIAQRTGQVGASVFAVETLQDEIQRGLFPETVSDTRTQDFLDNLFKAGIAVAASPIGELPGAFGRFFETRRLERPTVSITREETAAAVRGVQEATAGPPVQQPPGFIDRLLGRTTGDVTREEGVELIAAGFIDPMNASLIGQTTRTTKAGLALQLDNHMQAVLAFEKKAAQFGEPGKLTTPEAVGAINAARRSMEKEVGTFAPPRGEAFAEEFSAIQKVYDRAVRIAEGKLYRDTNEILSGRVPGGKPKRGPGGKFRRDVTFKIERAQTEAARGRVGVLGKTREGGLQAVDEASGVVELQRALADLLALDPTVGTVGIQGVEFYGFLQIQKLRTRFYNLSRRVDGEASAIATRIGNALGEAMKNPIGATPEGRALARRAVEFSKQNHQYNERLFTREMIRVAEQQPLMLMQTLVAADSPDRMLALHKILRDSNRLDLFDKIKNEYRRTIHQRPTQGMAELDRLNPQVRKLLMSKEDEIILRKYAAGVEEAGSLESVEVAAFRDDQTGETVVNAILAKDDITLNKLIQAAGGKNTELGLALKRGVINNMLKVATIPIPGRAGARAIHPPRAVAFLERLKRSGRLDKIFDAGDLKFFEQMETILTLWRGAGFGEGLLGATLSRATVTPGKIISSRLIKTRDWFVARLLISKQFQRRYFAMSRGVARAAELTENAATVFRFGNAVTAIGALEIFTQLFSQQDREKRDPATGTGSRQTPPIALSLQLP